MFVYIKPAFFIQQLRESLRNNCSPVKEVSHLNTLHMHSKK